MKEVCQKRGVEEWKRQVGEYSERLGLVVGVCSETGVVWEVRRGPLSLKCGKPGQQRQSACHSRSLTSTPLNPVQLFAFNYHAGHSTGADICSCLEFAMWLALCTANVWSAGREGAVSVQTRNDGALELD